MPDAIEEIKNRLNIVDFISSYVSLKKAGRNFKTLCPFHQEKTPSFIVSPEKQIWHCFGCGRGGSVIDFVMEIEGLDFYDALKFLGEKAGVKIEPVDREVYSEKKQLYELNELAVKFYQFVLWKTKPGKSVLQYLKKRGFSQETIDKFKIGYAPNQRDALSRFLLKREYSVPLLIKSGLVIKKDNPKVKEIPIFDRFRGRVMFPIFNQAGYVCGFSGRILPKFEDENIAKYLNSPDTPIFNKSFILYGLNFAKQEIMQKDYIILVEGQTDVISSHQAGFSNTVASSGTSLTESQLDLLKRFSNKIFFAFDQDSAGQIATERGIELAIKKGFFVYVVFIPEPYKDVDECVQKKAKKWSKALENKKNIVEYFFQSYAQDAKTIEERKQAADKILPWIKIIPDPIIQGEWVQKLSDNLEIPEPYLYEALGEIFESSKIPHSSQGGITHLGRLGREEKQEKEEIAYSLKKKEDVSEKTIRRIVALLFVFPILFRKFKKDLNTLLNKNKLYTLWLKFYNQKNRDKNKFLKLHTADLALAVLEVENEYSQSDNRLAEKELKDLVNFLKQTDKTAKIADLQAKIKACEKQKDNQRLKKLLEQLQNLILKQQ